MRKALIVSIVLLVFVVSVALASPLIQRPPEPLLVGSDRAFQCEQGSKVHYSVQAFSTIIVIRCEWDSTPTIVSPLPTMESPLPTPTVVSPVQTPTLPPVGPFPPTATIQDTPRPTPQNAQEAPCGAGRCLYDPLVGISLWSVLCDE
jgi:hypothetical protein